MPQTNTIQLVNTSEKINGKGSMVKDGFSVHLPTPSCQPREPARVKQERMIARINGLCCSGSAASLMLPEMKLPPGKPADLHSGN